MIAKTFIFSAAFAASVASAATVTIDFNGLPEGQSPGSHYADLGVQFEGGIVRYNHLGAYVASPVSVLFSQPVNNLNFGADGLTIDSHSTVCFEYSGTSLCEPMYLGSVSWMPYNQKRDDWYPGQTWLTQWRYPNITSVRFVTEALTSLSWTMQGDPLPPAGEIATGEIPEPGLLALMLTGLLALAWNGRRTGSLSVSALGGARRANEQYQKHGYWIGAVHRSLPVRTQGGHEGA